MLEPGMMLTVEPGCYIRRASDVPDEYANIGVRIEDDVLVTEGEAKVMSAAIPSKLEEVEAAMARLKQEVIPSRPRALK